MTPTPHDALFKSTFSQPEHAAVALRQALPAALAARIDFASLVLQPGSFIDEALAASHSDLLFTARLERASLFIYVLFGWCCGASGMRAIPRIWWSACRRGATWSRRCVGRLTEGLRSCACGGSS
ncbi:Rpn family recombination-promoting nuclease/putative transposase [Sorangium sp. So ce302]|uniref:Rpn family recombination-promoting nuclease/putative transposase n=1 Tax=Sorangium sp. So ce302 TaxID=3133297 RepID=UPI003F5E31CE